MRRVACLVTLVGACGFAPTVTGDAGGGSGDAHDGRMIDTPPGLPCFGSNAIDLVCSDQFPSATKTYSVDTPIDTDNAATCVHTTANGVDVCVVAFGSITIAENVTLTVHGSRPLVLVATGVDGSIVLAGPHSVIDVGSHQAGGIGAGAFSGVACTTGATAATSHGGGYGGTYTQTGGGGGNDNQDQGGGLPANAQSTPTTLHGGCSGSAGGGSTGSAAGGGAVALIAPTIQITGFVSASGAGGDGAIAGVGGNGGGAGGAIVLDAPTINGVGAILAQGGGGGEGSAGNTGFDGFDGFIDPLSRAFEMVGGGGGSTGGDGGHGGGPMAPRSGNPGPMGGTNEGGGGGGGAAGITLVFRGQPAAQLAFSPPHA